ncbi:MAG: class I SAM-dependent methyltransferase [bacterium]
MAVNPPINERHKFEKKFYDHQTSDPQTARGRKKGYYEAGALDKFYAKMMHLAGDLKGKRVLDFGCGKGGTSVNYTQRGALVIGLDISRESLKKAHELAQKENLQERLFFIQGAGEYLPFRRAFDIVMGISVLHHLDLCLAIQALQDILKEDGRAIFLEPLAHNPLISLFRKFTPWKRTKDEQPLSMDFIESLKGNFSEVNIYGFGLFSVLSFIFFPLRAYGLFRLSVEYLSALDDFVFQMAPGIQRYCWGVIIDLHN